MTQQGQHSGGLLLATDCLQDTQPLHQLPASTAHMLGTSHVCKAVGLAALQAISSACLPLTLLGPHHAVATSAVQFTCVGHSLYSTAQNSNASSSSSGSPDAAKARILPYCEGLEVRQGLCSMCMLLQCKGLVCFLQGCNKRLCWEVTCSMLTSSAALNINAL